MDVIWPIIGVVIAVGVIGGVIYAFRYRDATGEGIAFSTVVSAYVALMIAVSTLVLAAGVALLGKAAIAEVGDRDLSYNTLRYDPVRPVAPPAAPGTLPAPVPADPQPRNDPSIADRPLRKDVAEGLTLAAIGGVVLAAHVGLRRGVRRRVAAFQQNAIDRALAVVMTLVGGIGFVVAGGVGLSRLLRRTVLESDLEAFEPAPQPGGSLAWAVVWLVLWVVFGAMAWRQFFADRPSDRRPG